MLTRCPYPECLATFEIDYELPKGDWHWPKGRCSHCGQNATLRPLEVLDAIDRVYEKRSCHEGIGGGMPPEMVPHIVAAVLEDIRSLWNVGSMFRTSDAAGAAPLYLCGVTGCPPRKELSKTSLGSVDSVPWQYHKNSVKILRDLRAQNFKLIGLERTDNSRSLFGAISAGELISGGPICLIVGNEVCGLSFESLSLCDAVCHLPMRGMKESLNVAVAFGIAIYCIAEAQRGYFS